MKYLLIDMNGNITEKKKLTLKQMQKFVGGYVELVGDTFCNEDGIRLNLRRNEVYPRFLGNIIQRVNYV